MAAPPSWLNELANNVVNQISAIDVLAPLGCHYYHNEPRNQWEVTIFASNTETLGGEFDGKMTASNFHIDVLGLIGIFDDAEQVHWQALSLGEEDDLGPHLSIEGTHCGESVWLRVLATAPERFEAGRLYHAKDMRLAENW